MSWAATRPRPRVALVAILVVAILALGAGAYAVASAVLRPGTATGARTPPPAAGPTTGASPQKARPVRGRITAIGSSAWTVQPAKGSPITVDLTNRTKFGTKKRPAVSADFAVGTRVVVAGARVGDRIKANRVYLPQAAPGAAPSG